MSVGGPMIQDVIKQLSGDFILDSLDVTLICLLLQMLMSFFVGY